MLFWRQVLTCHGMDVDVWGCISRVCSVLPPWNLSCQTCRTSTFIFWATLQIGQQTYQKRVNSVCFFWDKVFLLCNPGCSKIHSGIQICLKLEMLNWQSFYLCLQSTGIADRTTLPEKLWLIIQSKDLGIIYTYAQL